MTKSPIKWMGGKEFLALRIVQELPLCDRYVEPFGGAASVLFARKPRHHELEVYNDLHGGVVHLLRTLRDNGPALIEKLELTLFSSEEYKASVFWEKEEDSLERARKFYVFLCQGFNALVNFRSGWARDKTTMKNVRAWLNRQEKLQYAIERLRHVLIERDDWRKIFERYDEVDTLFYLDPPYVLDTISNQMLYTHVMTTEEHIEMVEIMLASVSMIALSGYRHEVYEPLERNGWKRIDWDVKCASAYNKEYNDPKSRRIESLWLNPLLQSSKNLDASPAFSDC